MKQFIVFVFFYFSAFCCAFPQGNLVPNMSFEIHDSCPNSLADFRFVSNWKAIHQTPDYNNKCCTTPVAFVPDNYQGFQEGFSDLDSAYVGIALHENVDTLREFLGVQLLSPMQIGVKYYISFLISGGSNTTVNLCYFNKMGVKLITDFSSIGGNKIGLLNNQSMLYEDSVLTDTTNWNVFRGSIIADSLYNGIIIGNFFNLNNINIYCLGPFGHFAYYYIDHVCVSSDSGTCVYATGLDPGIDPVNPVINFYSDSHTIKVTFGENFSGKSQELKCLIRLDSSSIADY